MWISSFHYWGDHICQIQNKHEHVIPQWHDISLLFSVYNASCTSRSLLLHSFLTFLSASLPIIHPSLLIAPLGMPTDKPKSLIESHSTYAETLAGLFSPFKLDIVIVESFFFFFFNMWELKTMLGIYNTNWINQLS